MASSGRKRRVAQWCAASAILIASMSWSALAASQARDLASPMRPEPAPSTASTAQQDDDEFGDGEQGIPHSHVAPPAPTPPSRRLSSDMTPVLQPPPTVTVVADDRSTAPALAALVPPPPGPGLVPIVFDADPSRALVITRLLQMVHATGRRGMDFASIEVRGSSYGLVCVAPCATWVEPGAMRFGVGPREDSRWFTRILQIDRPSTLTIRYVDNAMLRLAGGLTILAALTAGSLATFDAFDGGELVTPIAVGAAGLVGLFVGLGLVCAGDGVEMRVLPSIPGWR